MHFPLLSSFYIFSSLSPLYSSTKYNGLFFVSLNILPKYSPLEVISKKGYEYD